MRAVVVGGGVTGLAAALELTRRAREGGLPLHLALLEAGDRFGGKVRTERTGRFLIEQGPDSLLARKPWALELIRGLGLGGDLVGVDPAARRTYLALHGRLEPLPAGLALGVPLRAGALLRTGLLSPAAKARAALEPLIPPRPPDGDESIAAFFRRRLGREASQRLAEPLLAAVYAGRATNLGIRATFPQLAALEADHGSLRRGMTRRSRRRGAGAGAGDGSREAVFVTLRSGLERMTSAAVDALDGARLLTGARVTRLEGSAGGGYHLRLAGGEREDCDAVVLATPAYASARLLERIVPAAAEGLAAIPYASTAVVALAYPRRALPRALDGSGFLVPEGQARTITGCTWLSTKWPHTSPPDAVLLRCFAGRAGGGDALELGDAALVRAVRDDLRHWLGLDAEPDLARVYRWPRSMPQYTPRHLERVAGIEEALAGHPRLAVAGAGLRGLGVPDCVRQGREAAARLLES